MTPKRKRRAEQERLYREVTKPKWLEENPICQFPGCFSRDVTVHHKKSRLGKLLNDTRYFMTVCAEHHDTIENQKRAESYEKGYLIKRNSK